MRFGVLSIVLLLPSLAFASGPPEQDGAEKDPLIYGGTLVPECGWPTTVSMGGSCTGTLVSPNLVFYAAHCGSNYSNVWMGERISPGHARTVPTEFCMTNPQFDGNNLGAGVDFAFCKLAQPVTDVPIVPILMGCETSILQIGEMVAIVGFGQADNGPYGQKREVEAPIQKLGAEAWVGGSGKSSCSGDSGGPLFIKLREDIGGDGSWRVFGVTSWGLADNCPAGGSFGLMHKGVAWVEENSGVDITPCHDADGTWNPTPYCRGFPLDPGTPHGDWGNGCAGGPVGDWSTVCGAKPEGDDVPPTVTITAPMNEQRFDSDPNTGQAQFEITVDADDGDGWGIREVRLLIDDTEVPNGADPTAPYGWPGAFGPGTYKLVARAVDLNDNITDSAPVYVGVDMDAEIPEEGETGDTDDTGGTDDGDPGIEDPEKGCGCSTGRGRDGMLAGMGLLALLGVRRRRRASRPC